MVGLVQLEKWVRAGLSLLENNENKLQILRDDLAISEAQAD